MNLILATMKVLTTMRITNKSQAFPYVVTVAPEETCLAVTADQARTFLRVEEDLIGDTEMEGFIRAAQATVERFTKLTIFFTTFETKRDTLFFNQNIQLRRAPLQSITSIKYLRNDVETTIDASTFKAIRVNVNNFGDISLKQDETWPTDIDNEDEAITILFIAGMSGDALTLEHDLLQGILRVISDLYYNRGDCSCSDDDKMSGAAKALLGKYRILGV